MFKKGKCFSIIAGLVFFVALSFTVVNASPPAGSAEVVIEKEEFGRTPVTMVKVLEIADSNSSVVTIINETLMNEAAQFAKEYQSEIYETSSVDSKVMVNQNKVLSVIFKENFYPFKAAHSTTLAKAFNFNLETGKNYTLGEIFKKGTDYKLILDTVAKADLEKRQVNLLEPFNGIDQEQEFYLKNDSLVLFYQLYRYTPFVDGFLEIEIPFSQIADALDDNFKAFVK